MAASEAALAAAAASAAALALASALNFLNLHFLLRYINKKIELNFFFGVLQQWFDIAHKFEPVPVL